MFKVFVFVTLIALAYTAPSEPTPEAETKPVEIEAKSVVVDPIAPTEDAKDETLKTDATGYYSYGWPRSYSYSYYPRVKYYSYPTYYSSGWSNYGWPARSYGYTNGWGSYW